MTGAGAGASTGVDTGTGARDKEPVAGEIVVGSVEVGAGLGIVEGPAVGGVSSLGVAGSA